jgi:hypothetical protein
MTYATDCYKPVTGQVFLSATIVKNLWGYGVSQFLNNWNKQAGYVKTTMTNMALFLFFIQVSVEHASGRGERKPVGGLGTIWFTECIDRCS